MMKDPSIDELAEALSDFEEQKKPEGRSARQQRVLAGFEEIERFAEQQGREPQHGEDRDIFERLYAVRLDRLRRSPECREILTGADPRGLLGPVPAMTVNTQSDEPNLEQLSESLADLEEPADDVTLLKHVRSPEEIRSAQEVAQRCKCEDFDLFRPLFDRVQQELGDKMRRTSPFKYREDQTIEVGDWFILDGQKTYVAGGGETFMAEYGERNRRLRVIFDNGTESDLLMRSLQRALNKDGNSRRILPRDAATAPLFSGTIGERDLPSGTIYVLRSKSDHPYIAEHRTAIHKIGVTGGDVKARLSNAKKDPTYLLADVEIVATYKLANLNRIKLEALLQRIFGRARLDVELRDRFGSSVEPREWFLVPLPSIDEAIEKIRDGTIAQFQYDPKSASLSSVGILTKSQ
jgi:hypothetical protein